MSPLLLLLVGLAAVLILGAKRQTKEFKQQLQKKLLPAKVLPRAIRFVLIAAQCSELLKMIEQTSLVHLVAALLLLAIVLASRSETEEPGLN